MAARTFSSGHGPEPEDASHLAYIRAGSGARAADAAGMIPISSGILDHHITKFKAGGTTVSAEDEAECRSASHILQHLARRRFWAQSELCNQLWMLQLHRPNGERTDA